ECGNFPYTEQSFLVRHLEDLIGNHIAGYQFPIQPAPFQYGDYGFHFHVDSGIGPRIKWPAQTTDIHVDFHFHAPLYDFNPPPSGCYSINTTAPSIKYSKISPESYFVREKFASGNSIWIFPPPFQ